MLARRAPMRYLIVVVLVEALLPPNVVKEAVTKKQETLDIGGTTSPLAQFFNDSRIVGRLEAAPP